MRWTRKVYVAAADHVLRTRPANRHEPVAGDRRSLAAGATELAVDAAHAVLCSGRIPETERVAVYLVATVAPALAGVNLAAAMAPQLRIDTHDQPLVTLLDDRTGIINALELAADRVANADGPSHVLITAGDAAQPHDAAHGPTAGAALLLSSNFGVLRLLSTAQVHDPDLDRLRQADARADYIRDLHVTLVQSAIDAALSDASPEHSISADSINATDINYFISHAASDGVVAEAFIDRLGGDRQAFRTVTGEEPPTTYLGIADLLVRLGAVDGVDDKLQPGDLVLLVAVDDCSAAAAVLRAYCTS
jgi:hypothetical protein